VAVCLIWQIGQPCLFVVLLLVREIRQDRNLFTNYENFRSQINLAESFTSSDFGVGTGLLNQSWWEYSRFYYVNIERSSKAEKMGPRNINISFTNGSLLNVDVMVFIFYSDEFTIDINTGIVLK
jgi:hypothetical protein